VGVDLSPAMISVARSSAPELDLRVGSLLDLPFSDGELAGAVAMYSIIHLAPAERAAACRELARTVRPGGLTLLAFHASDASHRPGDADVVDEMLGLPVELTAYFLGADEVSEALSGWGLGEIARLEREADPDAEYPSRRCYLLSRRR
jgi:SAM-dependent methyltransferase